MKILLFLNKKILLRTSRKVKGKYLLVSSSVNKKSLLQKGQAITTYISGDLTIHVGLMALRPRIAPGLPFSILTLSKC